jgi:hypothetical protein
MNMCLVNSLNPSQQPSKSPNHYDTQQGNPFSIQGIKREREKEEGREGGGEGGNNVGKLIGICTAV